MRLRTILIIITFMVATHLTGVAQESGKKVLTLEECIAQALESNYSVIISGNNLEITRNNVTLAPFLPSISLNARGSENNLNQRDYQSDGSKGNSVVKSQSALTGASLNWRLFDGFNMFATREKQEELLVQGEYNFRSVIENLVMKISSQYYSIISIKNQVDLLTELVDISQIRYNQALTRYNIGSDSGLEYKQAKIYLNSDSSKLMLQKENLKNAYIELFSLINLPFDSNYQVEGEIVPEQQFDLRILIQKAMEGNATINSIKVGEKIVGLDTKIALSQRYPSLDFSAGYNYNLNNSQFFPSKFNESHGLNWGFSLSVPIFNGNEVNRKIKNARLSHESARIAILQAEQELESELRQLYNLYNNSLRLIQFEEENRESAYLNLEAAMEKYRLGSLSGIEFRDYQLSYLDASDRKLRALYQTKVSEITLNLLAGELFKNRELLGDQFK